MRGWLFHLLFPSALVHKKEASLLYLLVLCQNRMHYFPNVAEIVFIMLLPGLFVLLNWCALLQKSSQHNDKYEVYLFQLLNLSASTALTPSTKMAMQRCPFSRWQCHFGEKKNLGNLCLFNYGHRRRQLKIGWKRFIWLEKETILGKSFIWMNCQWKRPSDIDTML